MVRGLSEVVSGFLYLNSALAWNSALLTGSGGAYSVREICLFFYRQNKDTVRPTFASRKIDPYSLEAVVGAERWSRALVAENNLSLDCSRFTATCFS